VLVGLDGVERRFGDDLRRDLRCVDRGRHVVSM
jgi:hypothetical protein